MHVLTWRVLCVFVPIMCRSVCVVANYLFPQGRVVSGDKAALEEARPSRAHACACAAHRYVLRRVLTHCVFVSAQVQKAATAAGALKAQMVAVSGAFHTSRMDSAAEALKAVMAQARPSR
jgi:[acyl-carrier-protein] S-malonyltransferase